MNSVIILKVLKEKRRAIVLWALAIGISNIGLALLFPAMRDTMGAMTESVPKEMENWFGSAEVWQTYTGFAGQELFGQMSIILVVMAILFGGGFLAGYEGNGALLTLLSRPVNRKMVFWQKYAAFFITVSVVAIVYLVGILIGGLILGETLEFKELMGAMLMVYLLALSLGSVAFSIGAITGNAAMSGITTGLYAFVAYLVSSLSTAADIVETISYGSLFRYASPVDVIADGISLGRVLVLLAVPIVAVLLALPIFTNRDLNTR